MSRFTFKNWCKLPFVIVVRLPFALALNLFDKLVDLFSWLSDKSYVILSKLPEVHHSDEWLKSIEEQNVKQRLKALNELNGTSQKG